MDLLKIQVMSALRRAKVGAGMTQKIRVGLTKQYIATVEIFGVDASRVAWCRLHMTIDWSRHRLHIEAGRKTVAIDNRWVDDTAIELDETLLLFDEYMSSRPLRVEVQVTYASWVDAATADRELGLVEATPIRWAGRPHGVGFTVREVDEFSLGIEMV